MGIEFGKGGEYEGEKSYVGMAACPICGKDSGVLLNKRLQKTFKHGERYPMTCAECEKILKVGGVFLIEVRDDTKEGDQAPYRTGYIVGLSKQWAERNGVTKAVQYIRESELKIIMGDDYKKEIG